MFCFRLLSHSPSTIEKTTTTGFEYLFNLFSIEKLFNPFCITFSLFGSALYLFGVIYPDESLLRIHYPSGWGFWDQIFLIRPYVRKTPTVNFTYAWIRLKSFLNTRKANFNFGSSSIKKKQNAINCLCNL